MLSLLSKGSPLNEVVKDLSKEYDVNLRSLYYDYTRRGTWIPFILWSTDQEVFLLDILMDHKRLKGLAELEYLRGDNSSARVGALRLIRELNRDFIELYFNPNLIKKLEQLESKKKEGGDQFGYKKHWKKSW